ncbi:MAG: dTDP-4-dehydrorhamnose reductase [Solirubrobacteraceae bacterium]
MRILITGAAGMLGVDAAGAAQAAGHEVVSLARTELDVTDPAAVVAALGRVRPDVVINCAAYTNVDGAEGDPEAAYAVNGVGAGNVADGAQRHGAWTLHVSSDYVFNGRKREPYLESDLVDPLAVYGASKLAGERAVAAASPDRHTTVRSSWLFGAAGPCFPKTILRLAGERDQLTVVDDQVGCPTFTAHLARGLLELAEDPERPAGVVHMAGEGQCSWFAFAREIVRLSAAACEVLPGDSASLAGPAPRPAYSVLRTERGTKVPRLPSWTEGLQRFMNERESVQ